MVLNTTGGGNAKRQGRKFTNNSKTVDLRKSENALEEYACATKMNGNGVSVTTHKGKELFCHMRGKFTGRNRRQNFITVGTWLLVGLRDWEKEIKNCDLIVVYDKDEVRDLRNLPGIDLKQLIKTTNQISNFMDKNDEEEDDYEEEVETFKFSETAGVSEEYKKLLEAGEADAVVSNTIEEEINIDDL
jgi:hypothetical protein